MFGNHFRECNSKQFMLHCKNVLTVFGFVNHRRSFVFNGCILNCNSQINLDFTEGVDEPRVEIAVQKLAVITIEIPFVNMYVLFVDHSLYIFLRVFFFGTRIC